MKRSINGFNIEEIATAVNLVQENSELGNFEFRIKNKWVSAGYNKSIVLDFYGGGKEDLTREVPFVLNNGFPQVLMGRNEGASPLEFILHGLAGCLTTTIVLYAAINGILIDKVNSTLKGDLDIQGFLGTKKTSRSGFKKIIVEIEIQGSLNEEEKQTLINYAKHSPVFDVVTNGVPVQVLIK